MRRADDEAYVGDVVIRWSVHGLALLGFPDPALEYRMPDLSDLFARNLANVTLDRIGGRATFRGPTEYPEFGIWMNFVRLTDAAIRGHEQARAHLAEYRLHGHEGSMSHYYLAVDELESAVSAAYRATKNSEALRAGQTRRLLRPTDRQRDLLRLARNRIEHAEERLADGRIKRGEAHFLFPRRTAVVIGDVELPYRDLASCITKMYRNIEVIRQASSK